MIGGHFYIKHLASYVEGQAVAMQDENLERAADWLFKLAQETCSQGYIGCPGAGYDRCESDHK